MFSHTIFFSKTFTCASTFYRFIPKQQNIQFNLGNFLPPPRPPPMNNPFQWANDRNPLSLKSQFVVPDKYKPNLSNVSNLDSIPTIDMNKNNQALIHDISKACEEYGFFQLTNHGISEESCHKVLEVITKFFNLPYCEKVDILSTTHMEDGKFYKYFVEDENTNENILMWGEAFFHAWHPVDTSYVDKLPINPSEYREIISKYIKEVSTLINKLLSLLSQALGLDEDYLQKRVGENPQCSAQANYYPPCPNPELTLGLRDHTDLKIMTVLLADEGVPGLQVLKDGEWFKVNSKPRALIVNVADTLQVLSNDKYKSACHRIVNNETEKRASFAIFVGPEEHGVIGPIEELLDDDNPPLYRNYKFSEFMKEYRDYDGDDRIIDEFFRI